MRKGEIKRCRQQTSQKWKFHDLVCAYYPGPLTVLLHNFGEKDFRIRKGDRIAKLLVVPYVLPTYVKAGVLDTTED